MKKLVLLSLLILTLGTSGYLAKKYLRIGVGKKAHAQASAGKGTTAPAKTETKTSKLDAPTDMPIPKELLNDLPPTKDTAPIANPTTAPAAGAPAVAAPAKSPQVAPLPPPNMNEELPPMETIQAKSPLDLDPSMKFLNNEGFVYDPTGRRDPFKSFIVVVKQEAPVQTEVVQQPPPSKSLIPSFLLRPGEGGVDSLEGNDVGALKLIGILWDVNDPKAMLRTPSNKVFMVRRKTRIGRNNGYVAAIREGEIVVVELTNDAKTPTTRVLTLQK